MEIICDTNIWYAIACGKINLNSLAVNHKLTATYVNLRELVASPNIVDKPLLIKKSIKAIEEYAYKIEYDAPLPFICKLSGLSKVSNNKGLELYDTLKSFSSLSDSKILKKAKLLSYELSKSSTNAKKGVLNVTDFVNNELLEAIKTTVKKQKRKKQHWKADNSKELKQLIQNWVYRDSGYSITENFDWNKIELLLGIMQRYFKELEISGRKIKPNDWLDLFNMAYVQPSDKYWTLENSWNRYIEEAELLKYKYEPSKIGKPFSG